MFDGNFIGGEWRPAASGATDDVLAPATGEVLAKVPSSDGADVAGAARVLGTHAAGEYSRGAHVDGAP